MKNSKPRFPSRDSREDARLLAKKLWPDAISRRLALQILHEDIARAHAIDDASWGVSLGPTRLRLNIGRGAIWTLEEGALWLQKTKINADELAEKWPQLREAHESDVEKAARAFGDLRFQNPSWRAAHAPGLLEFLREEFGEVPSPLYAQNSAAAPAFDAATLLQRAALNAGLCLSREYLGAFFLGLQTRGFVLLSGASGTGKSRLALRLAPILGAGRSESGEPVRLDAAFRASGKIVLPPSAALMAQNGAAVVKCEGAELAAKVEGGALFLRGAARKCALQTFGEEPIWIEAEIDEAGKPLFLFGRTPKSTDSNTLFLPVRPDWNDARALLGYANPLLNRFEWTPFLRFVLEANRSFESQSPRAFFVILDELNLARVEFYLGDLLSVLESGRTPDGLTREALRLESDAKLGGEKPPETLFLPPNLYFIGTLNDDETTQILSPKVLDRAFLLESPRADFQNFPPPPSEGLDALETRFLEQTFSRGGTFLGELRPLVAEELAREPKWRSLLQSLNEVLEAHGFDFGFRVFEEIIASVFLARQSGVLTPESAFDWALSAKILPKIRGGAARVEGALQNLEAWAGEQQTARFLAAIEGKKRVLEREGFV